MKAMRLLVCATWFMHGCILMVHPRADESDAGDAGRSSDADSSSDAGRNSDAIIDPGDAGEDRDAEEVTPTAGSCHQLLAIDPSLPSGEYTIVVGGSDVQVYCDMESGGWTRVVRFDAAVEQCPGAWTAGREHSVCLIPNPTCDGAEASAFFESPLGSYSEVRGFIRAYQFFSTDAFAADGSGLNGFYVDGISITRDVGEREHIWTLASGLFTRQGTNACPCHSGTSAPSFVGSHYFCDSGNHSTTWENTWYDDDPLWDGGEDSSCTTLDSPAWFERTLDGSRPSPIEVRILQDGCDENIGIFEMELYVR